MLISRCMGFTIFFGHYYLRSLKHFKRFSTKTTTGLLQAKKWQDNRCDLHETMRGKLNIQNIVFIADKGFYSKKNMEELKNNKLCYIIPLYRNNSLIDYSILLKANYKKEIKNFFQYQGRIIWYYEYEKEGKKLTTYLDERLQMEEEQDSLNRIQFYCYDSLL